MTVDFISALEDLLSGLVFIQPAADINSRIQEITGNLHKNYLNKPDSLPALAEIIRRNQHWQIRQSAALELKKAAARYWSTIPDSNPVKEDLKQKILDLILSEGESKVRLTLSRVIEPIAKVEVPAGKWPTLMTFIQQQTGSDGKGREIGLLLLLNLVETIPDSFTANLQHVFELFVAGIRDASNIDVQIISCKGIGAVACLLQKDQKNLVDGVKGIVPEMVAVLQKVLPLSDRVDTAVQLIEVFDSLMMSDLPIVNQHAVALIQMFVEISRNTEVSEDVRIMSLNFLMWAIVYKKQRILKEKIVEPIIQAILPIGLEPFEDEDDQESPPKMAFDLLNSMALNLPANVIFQPVMRIAAEYMKSNSSNYRLAGMMSMAKIMEGCPDSFSEVLETVIALIAGGMQDSDAPVKKAACLALSNLGEYLGDEVSEFHGQLMPHLFQLLQDSREDVQRFACIATDFLIENIGSDEIRAYSESLMTILLQLLQQPLESASLEIKCSAVGTIGTISQVMEGDFMAYFNHVIPFLVNYCELIDASQLSLRSMAMDATATIATSIGAQAFSPFLEGFMTAAVKGLSLDNCRLRECTYVFFGQVLALYEGDSQGIANRYLDVIVTELFKSINLPEEQQHQQQQQLGLDDGIAEDDEDASLYVNSAVIEEKEAACDTLSLIFKHAKGSFAKYLESSVQVFQRLSQHEHENLRKTAVVSLYRVLETLYEMSGASQDWAPGFDNLSASYSSLDANFMQLLGMVIQISMTVFEKEDDRMVVASLCAEMGEKLKVMGPILIANCHEALAKHLLLLYERKAPCQQEWEDEEQELDESELAEYYGYLMESVNELVSAMAQAMGPSFHAYLKAFLPRVLSFYDREKRDAADRSLAVGSLAEITEAVGSAITEFSPQILPIVLEALQEDDEIEVQSNAAFAAGLLCLHTQFPQIKEHYGEILSRLRPLFDKKSLVDNATDNACGAVARMIIAHADCIPFDAVLPVFMESLPLRKDWLEYDPIFQSLILLLQNVPNQVAPYAKNISSAVDHVIRLSGKKEENVTKRVKSLASELGATLQQKLQS